MPQVRLVAPGGERCCKLELSLAIQTKVEFLNDIVWPGLPVEP